MLLRWTRSALLANENGILSSHVKFIELTGFQRYCSENKQEGQTEGESEKSKKLEKFVLLHNDDGRVIGSRSLQVAHDLARRRKMGLVKIPSRSTDKDWYKIVPMKEVMAHESKSRAEAKDIHVGANIGDHDLGTKVKQITKWIAQGYDVRVAVAGNMQTSKGQLVNTLQRLKSLIADVPHGYSEPKATQGIMRCIIRPPKEAKPETSKKS